MVTLKHKDNDGSVISFSIFLPYLPPQEPADENESNYCVKPFYSRSFNSMILIVILLSPFFSSPQNSKSTSYEPPTLLTTTYIHHTSIPKLNFHDPTRIIARTRHIIPRSFPSTPHHNITNKSTQKI